MKSGYAIEFRFFRYRLDKNGEGIAGSAKELPGKTYSGSLTLHQQKRLERMIRFYLDKGKFFFVKPVAAADQR